MRKIFHKLITIEEALKLIKKHVNLSPVGVEEVDLLKAHGRVLAEDIIAKVDLPPFDRSEMDGYAVIAGDTYDADEDSPVKLKVIGKIEAGDEPKIAVEKGCAIEISTGAPIPPGANAVVMVEYTRQIGNTVEIFKPVAVGAHIVHAGSDLMIGEKILRKGTILTPREIGVIAAVGIDKVRVYKKPKIAIISTGSELVTPGASLPPYKVYDVNTYSIAAGVNEAGGEPIAVGIVSDNISEIRKTIENAIKKFDLVIISGGTSAGVGDLVYKVLNELGKPGIIVHGLKVKPGKPTVISVVNNKLIIGLPGWPVSALIIFNLIAKPVIRALAGLPEEEEKIFKVKVATRIRPARGRVNLIPVSITINEKGEMIAYPLIHHSGAIATLTKADGYIIIKENVELLEAGEEVQMKLLSSKIQPPNLTIIGSHCPALDRLIELLEEEHKIKKIRLISVGSLAGLMAVRNGEADIAGIHLLDEETLTYNIPLLTKYNVNNAVLIRGYIREQGLIVRKGNPTNIRSLEDLLREDVKFINRNMGSGTRVLIDYELKKMAEKIGKSIEEIKTKIKGYNIEAKTHSAVALAVLMGRADVGVAIRSIAMMYGLEFMPLKEEHFDFLVNKKALNKISVQAFIKALKSSKFKEKLLEIGMKAPPDMGEIIWKPKDE
ncbi:MAG: molybdopterin biosynthesis protein [archaeon GB-1867-005]|nr:molybdopterin biosynthesis protein [Candidatus Culexmicrobium cathedralense]